MTLRIHFTAADLACTRLAPAPRPLLELDIALRILQERTYPIRFGAWRQESFKRLSPKVRLLFDLVSPTGFSVDFLTPADAGSPEAVLDKVRATPRRQIRGEMERWASRRRTVPAWTQRLGDDPAVLRQLTDTLEHVHTQVVAPYQPRIDVLADADRALRMLQLAQGGVQALLTGLNPRCVRWNPPVLELTMASGSSGDVHLEGRGLLLVPSLFGAVFPALDDGAEPQPFMTFPIRHDERVLVPPQAQTAAVLATIPRVLSALLGRTRATVLCAIADHPGCTTTELARHAGISLASASEHATILRSTGFTATTRHRNAVLHTLTPAGTALLNTSSAQAG
ncbi:winged helix-turn-helix domain-containing protein [Streptomyces sp. NBC_00654]|uniref:ArsR/SmtB family transcription factor n=1 Tax=Streptomyces sp. NBC_00654 TaxID=2975799 RepID=UPI00224D46A3|nr:winged helix-turn-helix domain-containing protein [Streptomyces sp. NBC_00654]MCX4969158.1 winged helix-turn-helix domain-containing protein [Streptomyces sp. NBC_00654]